MLPRVISILLLCLSAGMAATLIHATVDGASVESPADAGVIPSDPPAEEPLSADPFKAEVGAEAEVADGHTEGNLVEDALAGETPEVNPADPEVPAVESHVNDIPMAEDKAAEQGAAAAAAEDEEEDSEWGFGSIRDSFQTVNSYFDSVVELMGGRNGVCQYRCRFGKAPQARPGYTIPEPNGCSSSLLGFQFDMGIPAMTKCCNQLDICYDTCGSNKYRCDSKFRWCLHGICSDLKKSLGFVSKVETCESVADALYNTVWTLGCRPFMNSQRAACLCEGEEKDEL
ncbi:group XIIB secretory phospholipase A2-like protein isoform X2 [Chanos chanos]|uniref:Group XIIB secretory phospholipase A2-like protein isoform X2 n=1 Tax=Chanos chanos TaxID=29144 RepID=A0A6J2V5E6_CHACN|nr:group XIIB secretory phospholipase A2-like protein isoform X2 [Chanos chanos]